MTAQENLHEKENGEFVPGTRHTIKAYPSGEPDIHNSLQENKNRKLTGIWGFYVLGSGV
jgi:hypothetical protein